MNVASHWLVALIFDHSNESLLRHFCASLHYVHVAHQKNTRDKKFAFPRGSSGAGELAMFCGAAAGTALPRCFLWNWTESSSFSPSTMPQPSFDPMALHWREDAASKYWSDALNKLSYVRWAVPCHVTWPHRNDWFYEFFSRVNYLRFHLPRNVYI